MNYHITIYIYMYGMFSGNFQFRQMIRYSEIYVTAERELLDQGRSCDVLTHFLWKSLFYVN